MLTLAPRSQTALSNVWPLMWMGIIGLPGSPFFSGINSSSHSDCSGLGGATKYSPTLKISTRFIVSNSFGFPRMLPFWAIGMEAASWEIWDYHLIKAKLILYGRSKAIHSIIYICKNFIIGSNLSRHSINNFILIRNHLSQRWLVEIITLVVIWVVSLVIKSLLLIPPLILLIPSLVLLRTIVGVVDVVGILLNFRIVASYVASTSTLFTSHSRVVDVHDFLLLITFIKLLHV